MSDKKELLEGLQRGLKTETEGKKFYNEAAKNASNDMAKAIFTSLASEENDHFALITAFYNKLDESDEWEDVEKVMTVKEIKAEDVKTIFHNAYKTVEDKNNPPKGDIEVYKMAREFENKAISLYKDLISNISDPKAQKFYQFLIEMEEEHYKLLDNTIQYLDSTSNWFQSQEGWVLEG